jgi:hypothetical protein
VSAPRTTTPNRLGSDRRSNALTLTVNSPYLTAGAARTRRQSRVDDKGRGQAMWCARQIASFDP